MHPAVLQSAFVRRSARIRPFLIASTGMHALIVIVGLAVNHFSHEPTLDLNQKPIIATLVRRGKPRDQKLLPRKEEEPPPPPEKVEGAPKPVDVKAPDKPAIPIPIPGAKAVAVSAKQDGVKTSTADRRKSLFSAFSKSSKSPNAEELEGQEDGDANGNSATQEGERYWGLLSVRVHQNYDVSATIPEQERMHLKASVVMRISKTGEVIRAQLVKSSGNELFDNAVLLAIKKASPFSPPPETLRAALERTGVQLEFDP